MNALSNQQASSASGTSASSASGTSTSSGSSATTPSTGTSSSGHGTRKKGNYSKSKSSFQGTLKCIFCGGTHRSILCGNHTSSQKRWQVMTKSDKTTRCKTCDMYTSQMLFIIKEVYVQGLSTILKLLMPFCYVRMPLKQTQVVYL